MPHGTDRPSSLRVVRGVAASIGARAVNPKWTSYGALEIDLFTDTKADFETFVAAIEPLGAVEFARDLQQPGPHLPKGQAVAEAVSLFNAERFWEAHEVLETLWRAASGEEKGLLQALILVCAAFVHVQKEEQQVALGVARRAVPKLTWDEPSYHGIDVAGTRGRVWAMVESGALNLFRL
jgi:uncharacterized protein